MTASFVYMVAAMLLLFTALAMLFLHMFIWSHWGKRKTSMHNLMLGNLSAHFIALMPLMIIFSGGSLPGTSNPTLNLAAAALTSAVLFVALPKIHRSKWRSHVKRNFPKDSPQYRKAFAGK